MPVPTFPLRCGIVLAAVPASTVYAAWVVELVATLVYANVLVTPPVTFAYATTPVTFAYATVVVTASGDCLRVVRVVTSQASTAYATTVTFAFAAVLVSAPATFAYASCGS